MGHRAHRERTREEYVVEPHVVRHCYKTGRLRIRWFSSRSHRMAPAAFCFDERKAARNLRLIEDGRSDSGVCSRRCLTCNPACGRQ